MKTTLLTICTLDLCTMTAVAGGVDKQRIDNATAGIIIIALVAVLGCAGYLIHLSERPVYYGGKAYRRMNYYLSHNDITADEISDAIWKCKVSAETSFKGRLYLCDADMERWLDEIARKKR